MWFCVADSSLQNFRKVVCFFNHSAGCASSLDLHRIVQNYPTKGFLLVFAPVGVHIQSLALISVHFLQIAKSKQRAWLYRSGFHVGEEFVAVDLVRAFSFKQVPLCRPFRCLGSFLTICEFEPVSLSSWLFLSERIRSFIVKRTSNHQWLRCHFKRLN